MSQVGIVHTFGFIAPIAAILVIIAILPVGSNGEEDPDDDIPIVVTIRVDQKEAHVQMVYGKNGTTTFTGLVIVDIPVCILSFQYLIVQLSYVAENLGQECYVNGTTQVIFPNGVSTQQFECIVTVPSGTSVAKLGLLRVNGYWSTSDGSETGNSTKDFAIIYVEPYSRPILSVEKRNQRVGKDEFAEFHFTVKNDGNVRDYFCIEFKTDNGVKIEDDFPQHLYLDEGESVNFTVRARSSKEGSQDFMVIVYSIRYGTSENGVIEDLQIQVKYTIVDKISSIIDRVRDDQTPIFLVLSFIGAVGLGALLIIGLRTKGFSKQYP